MPDPSEIATPNGPARVHLHAPDAREARALVLGHGAGGGVSAPDLVRTTKLATALGLAVALVEQPYRVAGRRSPAGRPAPRRRVDGRADALRAGPLAGLEVVTGGRSSGARVACRTAAATGAAGVLCLAFPLHPPGRSPEAERKTRLPELEAVPVPVLIVQGERDPFGMPPAGPQRVVAVVPGDHSLRSGLAALEDAVGAWLPGVLTGLERPPTVQA